MAPIYIPARFKAVSPFSLKCRGQSNITVSTRPFVLTDHHPLRIWINAKHLLDTLVHTRTYCMNTSPWIWSRSPPNLCAASSSSDSTPSSSVVYRPLYGPLSQQGSRHSDFDVGSTAQASVMLPWSDEPPIPLDHNPSSPHEYTSQMPIGGDASRYLGLPPTPTEEHRIPRGEFDTPEWYYHYPHSRHNPYE